MNFLRILELFTVLTSDKPRVVEDELSLKKKRMEAKKKLKAAFDQNYDDGGNGKSHYDDLKREVEQQTMVSINY